MLAFDLAEKSKKDAVIQYIKLLGQKNPENFDARKACSYVIKTEIPPVIDDKVALKILFGKARDPWEKELMENCTCVM